jgi:hypothetical protein
MLGVKCSPFVLLALPSRLVKTLVVCHYVTSWIYQEINFVHIVMLHWCPRLILASSSLSIRNNGPGLACNVKVEYSITGVEVSTESKSFEIIEMNSKFPTSFPLRQ